MNQTSILPKLGFGLIILVITGYALFRFTPLIMGPSISMISPLKYSTTDQDSIELILKTNRVTRLVIQGLDTDVSKKGETVYNYQLSEGINRIMIEAYDAYDSRKDIAITVVKNSGKPN